MFVWFGQPVRVHHLSARLRFLEEAPIGPRGVRGLGLASCPIDAQSLRRSEPSVRAERPYGANICAHDTRCLSANDGANYACRRPGSEFRSGGRLRR